MSTHEIARQYQEMMNLRKFLEIQEKLYDDQVVSQEPEKAASLGIAVVTYGLDAVKAKGVARRSTIETVHTYVCSEPLIAGDFFSVVLKQEITFKGKPRMTLEEIGVFQVKNEKIVKEQFFY